MGSLKLHIPWWNGREHKGFVWEFRLSISGIFHEIHLSRWDSRLDSTHLLRRLCSGILAIGHVLSVVDVWVVGSGEGLLSPVHWEVSRPTLDHHLSGVGSGQLSPRSPSVADQRFKVEFEKLNVECGNLQVQCPKSDVGSENLKDKC